MNQAIRCRSETTLQVSRPAPGVLEIRLCGGRRRNVLGRATLSQLAETLSPLEPDVRTLLLSSEGPDFCAGFDLVEAARYGAAGFIGAAENFAALRSSPVPVVAAIQGRAVGGGLELALAADVRVAARNASFSMPASELGLVYSEPGARILVEASGWTTARSLLLASRTLEARMALNSGLVTQVVSQRRLRSVALAAATRMAGFPAIATSGNRRLLDVIAGRSDADPANLHASTFTAEDLEASTVAFAARTRRRPVRQPYSAWGR